ncbi:unnamed protein product [Echinostoma caproni]|uniref:Uncharacterized protein n=1 Tax=Echinostoma caproni TaxID=27848 RepID=A0A183B016_9TREM|nr:unnamed protein product [Echinostoma caproni]
MNPSLYLEMAVKRAEYLEKLEAATAAPQECPAVGHDGAQEVVRQAWQRGRGMRRPWRPTYRFQHRPSARWHNGHPTTVSHNLRRADIHPGEDGRCNITGGPG